MVAVLSGVLVLVAAPAQAHITNVIPVTSDPLPLPTNEYTANDVIMVYGTADVRGGSICIVDADRITKPGAPSCDRDRAWGNTLDTGPTPGSFRLPVEGPPLRVGTWRLLAESPKNQLPSGQYTWSDEFRVVPCPGSSGCESSFGAQEIAEWKQWAGDRLDGIGPVCDGAELWGDRPDPEVVSPILGGRGGLVRLGFGGGGFAVRSLAGDLLDAVLPPTDYFEFFQWILENVSCRAKQSYESIVADPPDTAYQTVAQPAEPTSLPGVNDSVADDMTRSLDRQAALLDAMRIAVERYQGAEQDGAVQSQALQLRASAKWAYAALEEIDRSALLLREFAAEIRSSAQWADVAVTAERVAELTAVATRVRDEGFTGAELAELRAAGLSEDDIRELRAEVGKTNLADAPVVAKFVDLFDDAADALENDQNRLDLFARAALARAAYLTSAPTPAFTTTQRPDTRIVDFVDQSLDAAGEPPERVEWDFGDGKAGWGTRTAHAFAASGSYSVTVTVTDADGRKASVVRQIEVLPYTNVPSPTPGDDRVATRKDTPRSVNVLSNDTDPGGSTLRVTSTTTPEHGTATCSEGGDCRYTPSQSFTGQDRFAYIVENSAGGKAIGHVEVTVNTANTPPVADAGADQTVSQDGYAILSAAGSTDPDGSIEKYEWDYGDGSPPESNSSPPYPWRVYGRPGTFTATLTVTDDEGATDADTVEIRVENAAPGITVGSLPSRAPVGTRRSYAATVYTGATESTQAQVDFGDGTPVQEEGITGTQTATFDHAYEKAGTYTVTFTAIDSVGERATATHEVAVADARADAGPDLDVDEGSEVTLGGESSAPDGYTNVAWDFGDGTIGSGARPTHAFRDDGDYIVTVTVSDDKSTVTDTARVHVKNVAPTVTAVAGSAQVREPVAFRAAVKDPSSSDTFTYRWSFGDGDEASGQRPTHAYPAAGKYTARVEVTDDDGATASDEVTVVVRDRATGARDTRGRDFWLAFPNNYFGSGEPELTLFITGEVATSGEVRVPGLGLVKPFTVVPGATTAVTLPPETQLRFDDYLVRDGGIHVRADDDIAVYGLNRIKYTTDAFVGIPTDALGMRHRIVSYVPYLGGSEAAVVATENATRLTITPVGGSINGHPAGEPFSADLDVGETLNLRSGQDLTGTLIESNKPVAVFGGHVCANVPYTSEHVAFYCDHLVEQVPSADTWGRSFVTVPLATRLRGDTFRIVADEDDTDVTINGASVARLDGGEFHEQLIEGPAEIEASKPILVTQYSNGTTFDGVTSDPFMVIVPPHEQFQSSYTVATPTAGFRKNYLNLVVPKAAQGAVKVDGESLPASEFTAVGTSGFVMRQLEVGPGDHTISSPLPVGVTVYGFDEYDSYGYGGGFGLGTIATVARLTATPATERVRVGAEACVSATALTLLDEPIGDVRVDFDVAGANATTGFATTAADGVARFCWRGATAGTDTITATLGTITASAEKTWIPANRPPVAADDTAETPEDRPVTIPAAALLANDRDPDDEPLTLASATATETTAGVVRLDGTTVTFTPRAGFTGTTSFRYSIADPDGATATATVSVDVTPKPLLTVSDVTVDEAPGPRAATVELRLSGERRRAASVHVATVAGTATAGVDYTHVDTRVTFPPGTSRATVDVPVLDDALDESDEQFTLAVSDPDDLRFAPDTQGVVTIRDDDEPALGPAAGPQPPSQPSAADLLLACSERLVVLEDVFAAGGRVRLLGVADRRFIGRPVTLTFVPTKRVVATATVRPDGTFSATAPLPARATRNANTTRYEASIDGNRSLGLKLTRRMLVTSIAASGGSVIIAGRITGALPRQAADRKIAVQRRISCARDETVATVKPGRDGRFRAVIPAPPDTRAAVYRLRTKVPRTESSSRLSSTFTLPRAINIAAPPG